MKAILVIDIDDENVRNYGGSIYHYPSRRFVHIDVPLKPMPLEKDVDFSKVCDYQDGYYAEGWNACLEEIER